MSIQKIKFSYGLSRGTCRQRKDMAQLMTACLMKQMYGFYGNKQQLPVRDIERQFKKMMPEKIHFGVQKLSEEQKKVCYGGVDILYKGDSISRYSILIPAQNNLLHSSELPCLAHEATHFFDYLFSPKITRTYSKLYSNNLDNIHNEILNNYFYDAGNGVMNRHIDMLKLKKCVKSRLKDLPNNHKIYILKSIKEGLESEIIAYRSEDICANTLIKMGKESCYSPYDDIESVYEFSKKIKVLKEMLYEIISEERYKNSMNNAQTTMDRLKLTLGYCLKSLI